MVKHEGDRSELLTKQEMERLLSVVNDNLYFSTLYNFLRYSGRRIGEIYGTKRDKHLIGGILPEDLNFDTHTIKTYTLKVKKRKLSVKCPNANCNNGNTETSYKNAFCPLCGSKLPEIDKSQLKYKTQEAVYVPMCHELPTILQRYLITMKSNTYLFREFSLSYINKSLKKHIRMAGITKRFSIHGFRHYYVTCCKKDGLTNDEIALLTGHKNPSTLNIYTRMVPKDVEDKINRVNL
jgi:integrase